MRPSRHVRTMPHPRLAFDALPAALYAVGDIHGCIDQYRALEAMIVKDSRAFEGDKWIVTLGDHIDRGPDPAGVVSLMLTPPPEGFRRLALLGNHEQMMLDFLLNPVEHWYWLEEGGIQTLLSYGLDRRTMARLSTNLFALAEHVLGAVPLEHLEWMALLPVLISLPGWVLVHAGLRPGIPLAAQTDRDLVWIREPFLNSAEPTTTRVVHGHTPTDFPEVRPNRIGIDTRCFLSGRLTALRITPDGTTSLLHTG